MKRLTLDTKRPERGAILITIIIVLPFLIAIAVYYTKLSLTSFQVARFDQFHTMAQLAADAGADASIGTFDNNSSWTGTASPVVIHSDSKIKTTYTASLTGNSTTKTIAITGNTYSPASSATPIRTVKIDVDLYPVTEGNYSIVAGAGGLIMSNSSSIILGSVFVNGGITMSNNATIGSALLGPVQVQAADQLCPASSPYTNYPQVCAAGGAQPISLSNFAHIYGTVTATNQTTGTGMTNTGLVAGGTVAPQALPTYNRAAQEAAVTNVINGNVNCLGILAIPANTEITGNLNIGTLCVADLKGNLWVKGNVVIGNTGILNIDSSLGTNRPVVMVDGSGGISLSNSGEILPNLSLTGAEFITYYCGAGCSVESASLSGATLHTAQSLNTITISNLATAADSIFYAYWSKVSVSNSGSIGAVIGQTINLSNTASITLGSGASVGVTAWLVKGYRRQ